MVLIANFPVIGIVISYLVGSLSATFISNAFELPFINTNSFTPTLMLKEGRPAFITYYLFPLLQALLSFDLSPLIALMLKSLSIGLREVWS